MNAEIIAVGSEMLTPDRMDTNSLWLTDQLNSLGVEVVAKMIVGDDRKLLATLFRAAFERTDIVLVSGGLGPTEDDVTREAVAQALGRELRFEQSALDAIADRFARMGRKMAENNRRQAFVIEGAELLPNDRGTAPGQWLVENGRIVALLPGPPFELESMFEKQVMPRLRRAVPPMCRMSPRRISVSGSTGISTWLRTILVR